MSAIAGCAGSAVQPLQDRGARPAIDEMRPRGLGVQRLELVGPVDRGVLVDVGQKRRGAVRSQPAAVVDRDGGALGRRIEDLAEIRLPTLGGRAWVALGRHRAKRS